MYRIYLSFALLLLSLSACSKRERPVVESGQWACSSSQGACELRLPFDRMQRNSMRDAGLSVFMEMPFESDIWYPLPHIEFFDGYIELYEFAYEFRFVYISKKRSDGARPETPPTTRFRLAYMPNSYDDAGFRSNQSPRSYHSDELDYIFEYQVN